MIDYWKLGIIAGLAVAIFGSGWWVGHQKYVTFKAETESIAIKQEAHIESITKQQALVTKSIEREYDAKITALRSYYKSASLWNNTSGSKVPGFSTAPSATDVIASYNVLAGQCAETTQQLVSLIEWNKEQMGIK